jgi:hypothetical protein
MTAAHPKLDAFPLQYRQCFPLVESPSLIHDFLAIRYSEDGSRIFQRVSGGTLVLKVGLTT